MKKLTLLLLFIGTALIGFAQTTKEEKTFERRLKGLNMQMKFIKEGNKGLRNCGNVYNMVTTAGKLIDAFPTDKTRVNLVRQAMVGFKKADAKLFCEQDGDGVIGKKCTCTQAVKDYDKFLDDQGWDYK